MFDWKKSISPTCARAYPARAYRLRSWPELPSGARTAAVYQALSRMTQGPVSLQWFIEQSRLRPRDADELFGWMVGNGQLQIIDLAKFQDPHAACC